MPPLQIPVHRLDLIESELTKALTEYPSETAMDRLKFIRSMICVMRREVDDDEATVPVLDVEIRPRKEYSER